MQRIQTDILVSGGGIAGLTAACVFASAGYEVICVDPAPPVTERADPKADLRSTAFLQPAQRTLEQAGIWPHLAPFAAPLQIMRLADAGGEPGVIRKLADFDAAEISDQPFGWNLPNWLLRRELLNRVGELDNLEFRTGVCTTHMTPRLHENLVMLSDGSQIGARLVIGADGRNSAVREMLNIGVKTWRYGQKALVFCVTHQRPHNNISTEIHRSGGPFTLVPLPDSDDGSHNSAIVWMETGPKAAALMAMNDADFHAALNLRACDVLGPLQVKGGKNLWPIIAQKADQVTGPRSALVAEAAHVVPPIGAQGLNMSLADIQCLRDLLETSRGDPGAPELLKTYARKRLPDVSARVLAVDFLNRAAIAQSPALRDLRLKGLETLYEMTPLRRAAMKAGLGAQ